jgi:predicted PurR-regulated permease PerM
VGGARLADDVSQVEAEAAKTQRVTILLLTLAISVAFVGMIHQFLVALFLAAVFSGLADPAYQKILPRVGGRSGAAAAATLVGLMVIVLAPTLVLMNVIAVQAVELGQEVVPLIEEELNSPFDIEKLLPSWVPFRDQLEGSGPQVANKLKELAAVAGGFLVDGLSAATSGTARFFLELFVMVYAMFFFLRQGRSLVEKLIGYTPLPRDVQEVLIYKGLSVTRATVKGTLVIGLIQGALGGIAFAVAGIQGAAFWGAVMALASVIPSVGTAIVWVPAVLYLLLTGELVSGVGLGLWCALVVGSVDNLLRPVLVGGDTQMPDILVLVSTFGGLAIFGLAGLIIGPVIAALFVAMWQVYYVTFHDVLAEGASEAGASEP